MPTVSSRSGRRRFVPAVEQLEARELPAITTLTIENPLAFARVAEPVTSGIPIPESLGLLNTSRLRIVDAAGQAIPAQFDVLGRWNAGPQDTSKPIRWLLVHFAASVPAQSQATYQLSDDGAGSAPAGIVTRQDSGVIEITTGPARFQISRQSFDLFHSVWLDVNRDGAFASTEQLVRPSAASGALVQQGSSLYTTSTTVPMSVQLEESGPLRAVVRVEGFHTNTAGASLLRYLTRFTFYAGQSYVRVNHTIVEGRVTGNGNESGVENQQRTNLTWAGLRLQLSLSGTPQVQIRGAGDNVYAAALASADAADVLQRRVTDWQQPMSYRVSHNGVTRESGTQATRAWLDLSDSRWGVAVTTRDFWQKNPELLMATGTGRLRVNFPAQPYTIYQGMGLAEEVLFNFHVGPQSPAALEPILEGLGKDPLFAAAPATWMVHSGAFGELPEYPLPAPYQRYDQAVDEAFAATMDFIRQGKAYGLLNYLDMPIDRWSAAANPDQTSWGNSYYDAPMAEIREFARRGEYRWLRDLAFPQIRHFFTTDAYDTDDPASYQNGISGSRGEYHRDAWTAEYHYMESLWDYYYLTGDRRALERGVQAARTYATHPLWAVNADFGFGPGLGLRINSQKFHTMLQGWLATGDPTLKTSLDAQVRDFLTHMFTPEGAVVARYTHGNPYVTEQGWMNMLLLHDTIFKYQQATGDALALNFVIAVPSRMQRFHRLSQNPASPDYFEFYNQIEVTAQPGGFTTRPVFFSGNSDDYFYLSGKLALATALARAGRVSGRSNLVQKARELFDRLLPQMDGTVWDKPMAQQTLRTIHGLAIALEMP